MGCLDTSYRDGIWNPNGHICCNQKNCQYRKAVYSANQEIGKALVDMIKKIDYKPYKDRDYFKIPICDDGWYAYPQLTEMSNLIKKWALENESDFFMKKLHSVLEKYEKTLNEGEKEFRKSHHAESLYKIYNFKFKTEESIFNTVNIGEKRFHLLRKVVICTAYV